MQSSRLFMTIGATGLALATIASVAPASAATHPLPDWQDLDPTIATVARHDVRYTSNDGPGTVAVTDTAPRISVPALGTRRTRASRSVTRRRTHSCVPPTGRSARWGATSGALPTRRSPAA